MDAARPSTSFGHLALHYRDVTDGALAARLLRALGFVECYQMQRTDSGPFWHFILDAEAQGGADRIIYLMQMPAEIRAVYNAIAREVGGSSEVAQWRLAQAHDPELGFHAAVLVHSLEELEAMVMRVRALGENDAELHGRVRVTLNRARPGTPEVDARMDASPVFADITRYTYGRNGVQVFVETDLVAGGPLGDNWVFEFDYVFPGYVDHILSRPMPRRRQHRRHDGARTKDQLS
ncbi:hypothetical protein [uncultured Sphingomonas sp.]|uniref:hypothetical protein n=1 Tax=uncultured Sphingomonas sp. TaxID=158754 RepID=UPI0035C97D10